MRLKWIGRGTFYTQIARAIGNQHRISNADGVINWGLQGRRLF